MTLMIRADDVERLVAAMLVVVAAASCSGCQRTKASNAPEDSRAAIAAELIQLEHSFWDSVRRQDRASMDRLMAPEYQYISYRGLNGRSRAEELDIHFGGRLRLDSFQLTHWHVVWLTDDAVMLHYMNRAVGAVDGKPEEQLGGAVSTWAKHAGAWKIIARSEWKIAADEFPRE